MKIEAVVFDCGRTLFNPDTGNLLVGARETLMDLKLRNVNLGLLTVAVTDDILLRQKEIDYFDVRDFFKAIEIIPRSTKGKDFKKIFETLGVENHPETCLVVGDNLKREIEAGNRIGAWTVWTRQNLSADWKPENEMQEPKFIIGEIREVTAIVDELTSL